MRKHKAKKVVPSARKLRIIIDEPNNSPTKDASVTIPNAPKKRKFAHEFEDLEAGFEDLCREIAIDFNDELMMDDIEACIQEDDKHLISIDGRYVQTLEQENRSYQDTIAEMQHQMNILRDGNMCLQGEIQCIKGQYNIQYNL